MVDIKRHADLDVIDNFCFLFFLARIFFYLFVYCLLACLFIAFCFVCFVFELCVFFVLDSQLGRIKPS